MILGILVFWALGAYNRLVLLRGAIAQTFAALAEEWRKQLQTLEGARAAVRAPGAGGATQALPAGWDNLEGAVHQFEAALRTASASPFDVSNMQALRTAQWVLETSVARWLLAADPETNDDRKAAYAQWREHALIGSPARAAFNQAVDRYNAAISQFPASILAWIYRFRPACALPNEPEVTLVPANP